MAKVFISYRRNDSGYVAQLLYDHLSQDMGASNVFFDVDAIPFGVDFRKHIDDAIVECDLMLALVGDHWNPLVGETARRLDQQSDPIRIELELALQRNIPVIPVLVGQADMPNVRAIPESISAFAYRNAAEIRSGRNMAHHVEALLRQVRELAEQGAARKALETAKQNAAREDILLAEQNKLQANLGTERKEGGTQRDRPLMRFSAGAKFTLTAVAIVAGTILANTLYFLHTTGRVYENQLEERGRLMGHFVALSTPDAILGFDFLLLNDYVRLVGQQPDVVYAVIVNPNKITVASYINEADPLVTKHRVGMEGTDRSVMKLLEELNKLNTVMSLEFPIVHNKEKLGTLLVGISTQALKDTERKHLVVQIVVSIFVALLLIAVLNWAARRQTAG